MTRKLKALGLALVAVFATSALVASAAQAEEFTGYDQSTGTHTETVIHGVQEGSHSFTAGSGFGSITCTTATFAGNSPTGTSTELTITPTYSGCSDSFGRTVDVTMEGCDYKFTTPTFVSSGTYSGLVDLACPTGHSVTVHVTSGGTSVCTVTIHAQTGLGSNHYTNKAGNPDDVTVTTDITNLHTTTEGGFFNCGVSNGEHTDGSYVGNTTVTGETTGGAPLGVKVG
jgi:hypothetical protein